MKLLEGIIWIESKVFEGTHFNLFLPIKNKSCLNKLPVNTLDLPISGEATSDYRATEQPALAVSNKLVNNPATALPILLIVEDNMDVIYYLKACLKGTYQILEARNGKKGMELAFEHIPDVILSDVMMPQLDGYQLCEILKKDARTSHIPIVLLTAKVATENKYKGLSSGAAVYLAKPFDKKELLLRLENMVALKKQMQIHITKDHEKDQITSTNNPAFAKQEIIFIQQLKNTIQQHLSDENFKAAYLAKSMAMSQTQLYRKLKAITNQSTAQYIKSFRLHAAKQLLETTDYSIGQIAVEVGFKTQAHFTRSFQEEFGNNPSKTRK